MMWSEAVNVTLHRVLTFFETQIQVYLDEFETSFFISFFLLAFKFPTLASPSLDLLFPLRMLVSQDINLTSFLDSPCRDATYFLLASND